MNCPTCGKEMESGTMYCNHYPYWTLDREIKNLRRPKDPFRLRPMGDHTPSPLSPKAISSIHQYRDTMLCRSCGTVIFSFETDN